MQDEAENVWRAENLDRRGNRKLARPSNHANVARHLATGEPEAVRHRCPVCGAAGYRKATKRPGADTIFWCRRGHPHYLPSFAPDPFSLEHI